MISETRFATSYGALWRLLAPNLEQAVRRLNLQAERFATPVISSGPPERYALLNEIAFRIFAETFPRKLIKNSAFVDRIKIIAEDVTIFLSGLHEKGPTQDPEIRISEIDDIFAISQNAYFLMNYIGTKENSFIFNPKFDGCGIINSCNGDIYVDRIIIEVKSGDRNFRSVDFRQILTYCSLAYSSNKVQIDYILCANHRRGVCVMASVVDFISSISSKSPAEFFQEFQMQISVGGISR